MLIINNNDLYNTLTQTVIQTPVTVVLDINADTLMKYGSQPDMEEYFNALTASLPTLADKLSVITLSGLTNQQIVYIINRMTMYSVTGFVTEFSTKFAQPEFIAWLNHEMETYKID